jgi:DNA-binding NarL/FixJ family response regulator
MFYRYAIVSAKRCGTRLYYVEDSAELRSRIDRKLAQVEGVEVLGYSARAHDAIREIRRYQPDVVVLDLQLLEGSGIDVLKELRNDDPRPLIIVLTNHSDPTSREHSLKAGAKYFFDKSTEFDQFLAALRQLGGPPLS